MAKAAAGGLTDEQVEQLRADVSAGRTPRVQINGSGAVTAGTVRAVGDPAADGEDYVTVRVKLNGVTDDLRFAPRELSRGSRAAVAASAKVEPPTRQARAPRRTRTTSAPAKPTTPPVAPTPSAPPAKRSRASSRRGASSPRVSIVLSSVDATWTLSAQRGARSIVKAAPVNPGVVSALATMLALPAIDEAVAAVNDTARAEAEARAEQLRAELAELEAVLDSHRRP